jgi:2-dehydropantoate 2-reductase
MNVVIVGAGAIGSLLGHGAQRGGHSVTMIDLPLRVDQIRSMGGLMVLDEDGHGSLVAPFHVTDDYASAGVQDVVVLATKAQDLVAVAPMVASLIDKNTSVVTIQNGIPWWYLNGLGGEFGDRRIQCLDPDGLLGRHIPSSQIIGCVAYPAANLESDGRVRHVEGKRLTLGELDGQTRERTRSASALFNDAGYKSRVIDDIRSEIWLKAWGALSINPISALSRATMEDICSFDATRELLTTMMSEAQNVAEALGATFRHTIEKRIEGAKAVGSHKTSMLQDVEAGRPLELNALMLSVLELAELTQINAPTIRNIYACTALLNKTMQKSTNKSR